MSAENDLAFAYHMGYDDALAKRKPDASQTQILASDDLSDENAKLREEIEAAKHDLSLFSSELVASKLENAKLRELCADLYEFAMDEYPDGAELNFANRMRELGYVSHERTGDRGR